MARTILINYLVALKDYGYNEAKLLTDLEDEVFPLFKSERSWTDWREQMEKWTSDIEGWKSQTQIKAGESIIPKSLFERASTNIATLCSEINASYENNLFDCCAVMMRRLVEILLILTFEKAGRADEIKDSNGRYPNFDRLIDVVGKEKGIAFTPATKKDLQLVKNIGNNSAHKIWYVCTKTDLDEIRAPFRLLIQEFLILSGQQ